MKSLDTFKNFWEKKGDHLPYSAAPDLTPHKCSSSIIVGEGATGLWN